MTQRGEAFETVVAVDRLATGEVISATSTMTRESTRPALGDRGLPSDFSPQTLVFRVAATPHGRGRDRSAARDSGGYLGFFIASRFIGANTHEPRARRSRATY